MLDLIDCLVPIFGDWQQLCITSETIGASSLTTSSTLHVLGSRDSASAIALAVYPPTSSVAPVAALNPSVYSSTDCYAITAYAVVSPLHYQPITYHLQPIPSTQLSSRLESLLKLLVGLLKSLGLLEALDPILAFTIKQLVVIPKFFAGQQLLSIQLYCLNFATSGLVDTLLNKLTTLGAIMQDALLSPGLYV